MYGGEHVSWLMIVVAVVPPIVIMLLIYAKDRHEREPIGLLLLCALSGALSVLFSLLLEELSMTIISKTLYSAHPNVQYAVLAFLGIAAVEETGKFLALRLTTWKNRHFNYTFDGIVYSVYVSLGFALVENIIYVIGHGMQTGLLRAITAIPGHASFGVYMGFFYGYAKFYEVAGNRSKKTQNLWFGWLSAMLLHGFYDFFALRGTQASMVFFMAFIIAMDVIVIVQVFRSAKNDTPIYRAYRQPPYRMQFQQVYQNPYYAQQMQGTYRAPVYLQQQYGTPPGGAYGSSGGGQRSPYAPQSSPYGPQGGGQGSPYGPQGGGQGSSYAPRGGNGNPYAQQGGSATDPYGQRSGGTVNPYAQQDAGRGNPYAPRSGNPYAQQGGNPADPYGRPAGGNGNPYAPQGGSPTNPYGQGNPYAGNPGPGNSGGDTGEPWR